MSVLKRLAATVALIGTAFLIPAAPALAADPVRGEYYYSDVCGRPHVLNHIRTNFRYQVQHVPNLPDVQIAEFSNIYERRYVPADEDHPIARRFCGATVHLSDGDRRDIWYLIEEGMGFATLLDGFHLANESRGANIEFCVDGFDRWMVYNGACRVLR